MAIMNARAISAGIAGIALVLLWYPAMLNAEISSISVTVAVFQCSDGADNDGDGFFDFPNDPGCASPRDDDESASINKEVHTFPATSSFFVELLNPNNTALRLNIPENVTSSATVLNVTLLSQPESLVIGSHPLPSGKAAANTFYDISFMDADDASTTIDTLDKNVTLTFTYTADDIDGIQEGTLAAFHWNGSTWEEISGSSVDTDANTVTATTNEFSPVAIFGILGDIKTEEIEDDSGSDDSGGSSGGGGGAYIPAPTATVSFSGVAYPDASIILLEDATRVATTSTRADGTFSILYTKARTGVHTYSISVYDADGVGPALETFSVDVSRGVTTFLDGIVAPPTLFSEKKEVRAGDTISFSGYSVPNSRLTISVAGAVTRSVTVQADERGAWRTEFDSASLPHGEYIVQARAFFNGTETSRSGTRRFIIGSRNVAADPASEERVRADINGDGRVDLIDFSIVAYWYGKDNPPQRVDLHRNGIIDLRDFGVLAYYWTG